MWNVKNVFEHTLLLLILKIRRQLFSVRIMTLQCLIASFFLEKICHSQKQFGYEVFGHLCVADNVINSCCNIVEETAVKKVVVMLSEKKYNTAQHQSLRMNATNILKETTKLWGYRHHLFYHRKVYLRKSKELLTQ